MLAQRHFSYMPQVRQDNGYHYQVQLYFSAYCHYMIALKSVHEGTKRL
jgi:hypothetical protein